jgi:hypothetical protein
MDIKKLIKSWPVYRQITGPDGSGRGQAAQSARSEKLTPAPRKPITSRTPCARSARSVARRTCT